MGQQASQKKGVADFIDFIKKNQAELGIKSFGVVEQKESKLVRIYCGDEFDRGQFLKHLSGFNFERYWMDNSLPGTVMFIVSFKNHVKLLKDRVFEEPEEEVQTGAPKMPVETICKKKVKVQVTQIEPANFKDFLRFKGKIEPAGRFQAKAELSGTVATVPVNVGDRVTEGQELIVLDTAETLQKIAETDEEIKKWKRIYFNRSHWKVRSPRAEKAAQSRINKAETLKKELQFILEHSNVKAPAAGKVARIAAVGDTLEKDAAAVLLINDSKMKLTPGKAFEPYLRDGMKIKTHIAKLKDAYQGKVATEDGTVQLIFDNESGELKEGMPARFKVLKKLYTDAVVLDMEFVKKDADGSYTYIVNEKRAAKRYLELGPKEKKQVVVTGGLKFGDELIVSGLECVEDNKRIRVVVWDAEKNKFRKRKKGERPKTAAGEPKVKPEVKEVKKAKPVKKEEEKPVKLETVAPVRTGLFSRLGISFGYNMFMMGDALMKDVYGSSINGGFVELSYLIADKVELFFSAALASKKGSFTEFEEPTTLTMFPIYFGGKYRFDLGKKFTPFIGSALAVYAAKEKPEIEYFTDTPYYTDYGFSFFGGTYYALTGRLDLSLSVKYDYIKITVEDLNEKLDFSGLRLAVGLKLKL
jgi:membrane fusion protein (multidrug efflux system)